MVYTKQEKERLIRHFKEENETKIEHLKAMSRKNIATYENKVLRRLNTVSVTLWNVKIKDVLNVERQHQPSIRRLLQDIREMHMETYRSHTLPGISSNRSSTSNKNQIRKP